MSVFMNITSQNPSLGARVVLIIVSLACLSIMLRIAKNRPKSVKSENKNG